MKHFSQSIAITLAALFAFTFVTALAATSASAETYTGTVKNGTTNKVAAGVDVVLLSLQGNMEAVANTKTDAQGHFRLTYTPSGQMPLLLRAIYKGVNFHAMLPPGTATADVQVYEPTSDSHTVQFPQRLVVFQPNGAKLLIGEEYVIQNQSNPPVTYFKTDGDFEFQTPQGAGDAQVSAQGPERMPLVQGTMDRGNNHYAIAYAFRPGESAVRLSYDVPYGSNKATLHLPTTYAAKNMALLVPPTMTLSASGFSPAGTEQGMTVYSRDDVPAGAVIDVSISGTAPAGSADQQGAPDNGGPSDTAASVASASVSAVAPRLDTLKWVLLGGFASLFLLGAGFLIRKPVPVTAPVEANISSPSTRKVVRESAASVVASSFTSTLDAVDREVSTSLDELKDRLFKLELRHQAGTIPDAEYAEQRARTEKILRDLVRG